MKVLKPGFTMNEGSSSCFARLDVFVVGLTATMWDFPLETLVASPQLMGIMSRTGPVPVSGTAAQLWRLPEVPELQLKLEMMQSCFLCFCCFVVFFFFCPL